MIDYSNATTLLASGLANHAATRGRVSIGNPVLSKLFEQFIITAYEEEQIGWQQILESLLIGCYASLRERRRIRIQAQLIYEQLSKLD